MTPTGFDSWKHYFNFVFAREFRYVSNDEKFNPSKHTILQKIGGLLCKPIVNLADYTFLNIRNPLVILSWTIAAVAAASIIFYPVEFIDFMSKALPFAQKIEPWMLKLSLFTILESTILGVGLRTIGRINNSELWTAWRAKEIYAVVLGVEVVPKQT